MSEKIAFIGLGAMGGPMASNIIKKGNKVSIFDIDSNKLKKVSDIGGTPAKVLKSDLKQKIRTKYQQLKKYWCNAGENV